MRAGTWLQDVDGIYTQYRDKIPWGDQDILNIYFHGHPDQLYSVRKREEERRRRISKKKKKTKTTKPS